jgi:hypothetical protein
MTRFPGRRDGERRFSHPCVEFGRNPGPSRPDITRGYNGRMRRPVVRIRTLMAVVMGAGGAFAAMRAYPALWTSFLLAFVMFAVSTAVVLVVTVAALGVTACVDAVSRVVTAARTGRRPGRRGDDTAPPGSNS